MKKVTAFASIESGARLKTGNENKFEIKSSGKSSGYDTLKSVALKITAILAFIAINFIGYRAFSEELPVVQTVAPAAVSQTGAQTVIALPVSQAAVAGPNEAQKIPSCEIAPEGFVANKWKSIRIQVGDAIVAGAETLSDLTSQLKQLVVEQRCLPLPVPCSFAAEGFALGSWVKHRIVIKDHIAFGGDTTARLFEQAGQLKKIGICQ